MLPSRTVLSLGGAPCLVAPRDALTTCNLIACVRAAPQAYNDTECGLLYSTADQVGFCGVAEPPLWPALLDVPQVCAGSLLCARRAMRTVCVASFVAIRQT